MDGKVGPYKTLAYVAGIHTSIRCIIVNLNTGTHVILRMSWEIAGDPTILYLVIPLVHILFFCCCSHQYLQNKLIMLICMINVR